MGELVEEMDQAAEDAARAGFRIFIVEDEAIVADDLAVTLKFLGYAIAGIAHSGEAAIGKIQITVPDLILMDIHLAGKIDGVDAVNAIHELCDIPVIYLTAYADAALLARAKLTGPYGYILKPFSERELQSTIEMARYKYGLDKKLKESEENLKKLNEELEERVARRTATLRQQLAFLQQLIDTIPAPIYYKDANGVYLGCNMAFEAYTGISKPTIVGKTDAALFSSDMAAISTAKDSQLLTRRGIQVYQAKFCHADQTPRDVIFKKANFSGTDGQIAGLIGVMIDISDRVAAEEALKESEARFAAIVEDQSELVYRSTPEKTCVFANPAFLSYFGRTAEDTIGFLFAPSVHPDDAKMMQVHLGTLTPDRPAAPVVCRILHPDGSIRTLHWVVRAFFDSTGHIRNYQYVGYEIPPGTERP